MLIVADAAMPKLDEFFGGCGTIRKLPGREIDAAAVRDADVLLVRSITRVDASLVAGSRLRFVGSATAGCDHVDADALQAQGITFAHAPGCNANAVADYVMAATLQMLDGQPGRLAAMRVGVVGCGACGSRVRDRFRALGAEVMVCDPPRARAHCDAEPYVGLDGIYECDLVTLHVPLTLAGADATFQMLDVDRLKPDTILINAARGEALDGARLLRRLVRASDLQVALDVWPNEPSPDPQLVSRVALATPHIAGYSLDGKWRGTAMLYDAFCAGLGANPVHPAAAAIDAAGSLEVGAASEADDRLVVRVVRQAYDVGLDDQNLRAVIQGDAAKHGTGFDGLRKQYRLRRDFAAQTVHMPAGRDRLAGLLQATGFPVEQRDRSVVA